MFKWQMSLQQFTVMYPYVSATSGISLSSWYGRLKNKIPALSSSSHMHHIYLSHAPTIVIVILRVFVGPLFVRMCLCVCVWVCVSVPIYIREESAILRSASLTSIYIDESKIS